MKPLLTAVCLLAAGPLLDAQTPESLWSHEVALLVTAAPKAPVQSTDAAHPGSNVYAHASFTTTDFKTSDGKSVRIWVPVGAVGKLPLVAFGAGKSLGNPVNYQGFFEHLVKKGLVVASIQFEGSFFDTDFPKFARWFNTAVKETLAKTTVADADQVYFAGHSLGAQVAVIAAGLATGSDTTGQFIDPKGLLVMAFDNSRGPNNSGDLNHPAWGYAELVGANVQALVLEFEDDSIAGPAKTYASALYGKLGSARKQWVRVKGKTLGAYGLVADHNTPLTGGGAPLNIGGKAALNALDWHMVWKAGAGFPLALSGRAPEAASFVFGPGLLEGGRDSSGVMLQHLLMAQSF